MKIKRQWLSLLMGIVTIAFAASCGYAEMTKGGKQVKIDEAAILKEHEHFLNLYYASYFSYQTIKKNLRPIVQDPATVDWEKYSNEESDDNLGKFTVNPETIGMTAADFENAAKKGKIVIFPLKEFIGKRISEVFSYVAKTYSKDYYLPGIEMGRWISENRSKSLPKEITTDVSGDSDNPKFYLLGTMIVGNGNDWTPQVVKISSGELIYTDGASLGTKWDKGKRVLLLKR